jgi:hypothetical protein
MQYRVRGLEAGQFRHLYGLSDAELIQHGARRYIVDKKPSFPDRIEVRDAEPGETVLLLNFFHQKASNPYRASHAIFVLEGANTAYDEADAIPEVMRVRLISLRAFDAQDEMVDADVVEGEDLEHAIRRFFARGDVDYLHAHYAKRGCYAARIDRA